jgi:acetyl-CoA acetyltransferase
MCAAIVGYGETELGEVPGYSYEDLNMWAAAAALANSGVSPDEIDGFIATAPFSGEPMPVPVLAEYLGITPIRFGESTSLGGASHVHSITQAIDAVESGRAETVLVVAADSFLSGQGRQGAVEIMANTASRFEEPANIIPSLYAHAANWYTDTYDVTMEQLAKPAEIGYKHASMQPEERAQMNEPRSIEEILESPMIAHPLTLRQCSLISDGGGAFVVTTDERARELTDIPVRLRGFGAEHTHEHISQMPDFGQTGAKVAGETAMDAADVSHDDIDVIEIYDCFTITVLMVLEDLGFCEPGEAGDLAMSGDLELGGKWPMNTHGGAMAQVHPGLPSGMFHVTEAIRQLQGDAKETQVDDADTALVHGNGGIISTQTVAVLKAGE